MMYIVLNSRESRWLLYFLCFWIELDPDAFSGEDLQSKMCVAGSGGGVRCECPRGNFDKSTLYWDGIVAELQVFQDGRLFALAGDMFHGVTISLDELGSLKLY